MYYKKSIVRFLAFILLSLFILSSCGKDESNNNSAFLEIPLELQAEYKDFEFDESTEKPIIESVNPLEGRIGTEISIKGKHFGISPTDKEISIGGVPLDVVFWSDTIIKANIMNTVKSGNIEITTKNGTISGEKFNVIEETKEILLSEDLDKQNDNIIHIDKELTIAFPSDSISENDKIIVSSVKNGPIYNSEIFKEGKMFSIELESGHKLNTEVALEFQLEDGENAENTLVCYYDNKNSSWISVPTVYDTQSNKVAILTNHFSHWLIIHARTGGTFLSDDYFVIAYNQKDTISVPGLSTIDELAVATSEYLKEAYITYKKALGDEYVQELSKKSDGDIFEKFAQSRAGQLVTDYTRLEQSDLYALSDAIGLRNRVIVELNSKHNDYGASAGFSIKWASNTIFLPTKYKDDDELKTTAAHELFHNIQGNTFYSLEMDGFWKKLSNKWLIEATAEYASWGIAFPKSKPEKLHIKTIPGKRYDFFSNSEDGQEYGMSFFVEYALKKGDNNFKTLYKYMIDERPYIGNALEKYIKDKVGTTISMLYTQFWKDMFTMSDMPKYVKVPYAIRPKPIKNTTDDIENKGVIIPGAVNAFLTYPSFPENCENLVVSFSPPNNKMPKGTSVSITTLDNFILNTDTTFSTDTFDERSKTKPKWTMITEQDITGHYYAIFNKNLFNGDKKQIALMVFDSFAKHDPIKMNMNFIDVNLTPKNIDKIKLGETISFTASFSKVFPQAKTMELVWDFGDGNTEVVSYPNNRESFKSTIKHKYTKEGVYNVKISLYDTYNAKHLIAERIYKLGQGENIDITQTPLEPSTSDEITFKTSGNSNWVYDWDFGDNKKRNGLGIHEIKHKYDSQGKYNVKVVAYEDNKRKKIAGVGMIKVKVDNKLMDLSIQPSNNLQAKSGDLVEISVQPRDTSKSIDKFKIYWITKGSVESSQDKNKLMVKYNVPGKYDIEVKTLDQYSNTLGIGKAVIEITPSDNDSYKKYDTGIFEYDYSKLYFEENDANVEYKNIETKRADGIYITFFDKEKTKPQFVEYRLDGKFVGRDKYNENGQLLSKMYEYHKNDDFYHDYFEYIDEKLVRETHSVNDKMYGRQVLFNSYVNQTTGQITVVEYQDGKKHGIEKISNGDVVASIDQDKWSSIIEYKNGEFHGSYKTFFPDGTPKHIYTYIDGKKDGEGKEYAKSEGGEIYLCRDSKYDNGEALSINDYHFIAGKPRIRFENTYKNNTTKINGKFYNYKPNGILMTMVEEIYDEKGIRIKRTKHEYKDDGSLKRSYDY